MWVLVLLAPLALFPPRRARAQGQGVCGAISVAVRILRALRPPMLKSQQSNNGTGVRTVVSSNGAGYYTVSRLIVGTLEQPCYREAKSRKTTFKLLSGLAAGEAHV